MHKNNFIAYFLTLACFIVLTPSLATAQSDKVKSAMADLKAMAETLGAPKLQGSDLISAATKRTTRMLMRWWRKTAVQPRSSLRMETSTCAWPQR